MSKDKFNRQPSALGAGIGAGTGLLGALITLKSQRDIADREQKDSRASELATQNATRQIGNSVVQSAAASESGTGLLQGLRAADQMQRNALPAVQQAQQQDLARQDTFDKEQRIREERLGAGIGGALGAAGGILSTAFTQGGDAPAPTSSQTGTAPPQGLSAPSSLSAQPSSFLGSVLPQGAPTVVAAPVGVTNPATVAAAADPIAAQLEQLGVKDANIAVANMRAAGKNDEEILAFYGGVSNAGNSVPGAA